MLISVNVIGISIMLGFYAFLRQAPGSRLKRQGGKRKKQQKMRDDSNGIFIPFHIGDDTKNIADPVKEIDAKA